MSSGSSVMETATVRQVRVSHDETLNKTGTAIATDHKNDPSHVIATTVGTLLRNAMLPAMIVTMTSADHEIATTRAAQTASVTFHESAEMTAGENGRIHQTGIGLYLATETTVDVGAQLPIAPGSKA